MKNPRPLFLAQGLTLGSGSKRVGADGAHLKLDLAQGPHRFGGIAFRQGGRLEELVRAGRVDALFQLGWNVWNGRRSIQLEVKDLRPAGQAL